MCNESPMWKSGCFYLIMRTGIRQNSCFKKNKKPAMWKETWPNSKAINKHSYKISHSIYMETDKDKSHLTKLFYFQKAKRGGGGVRGPLQVWKQVLIKVKVRLSEEEPTLADTNLLTSPQGTATGLDPIPLAGPAWAWNGTNFTPGETWTRLCSSKPPF